MVVDKLQDYFVASIYFSILWLDTKKTRPLTANSYILNERIALDTSRWFDVNLFQMKFVI